MITEDYVSFETAKLLKEKGFDCSCEYQYINCISGHPFLTDIHDDAGNYYKNSEIDYDEYSAPTLQMVLKWLRNMHKLYIYSYPNWEDVECMPGEWETQLIGYQYTIVDIGETNRVPDYSRLNFITPESAIEAAIKYCLENLI